MKHSALALMIAKQALETPQFQQSWAVHMQAFGPLLGAAYPDDPVARVHVTNILNKISRADIPGAQATLDTLDRACGHDGAPQEALWHFLHGLIGEVSGNAVEMVRGYEGCNAVGHAFYYPHMKLGFLAQNRGDAKAIDHFLNAIQILGEGGDAKLRARILTRLAEAYAAQGDFDQAIAARTRAEALDPKAANHVATVTVTHQFTDED